MPNACHRVMLWLVYPFWEASGWLQMPFAVLSAGPLVIISRVAQFRLTPARARPTGRRLAPSLAVMQVALLSGRPCCCAFRQRPASHHSTTARWTRAVPAAAAGQSGASSPARLRQRRVMKPCARLSPTPVSSDASPARPAAHLQLWQDCRQLLRLATAGAAALAVAAVLQSAPLPAHAIEVRLCKMHG